MLAREYNITTGCDFGVPGHGKYVIDGLNPRDKNYQSMLMTRVHQNPKK